MPQPFSTIACNLDSNLLLAALPLLETGQVEAIEWSFDTLYQQPHIPAWFVELLTAFSKEKRLIGHGVFFSLFSGKWSKEQENWLRHLEKVSSNFQFDHITEHFGFMTGEHFHAGAPISIPFTKNTLALGRDRLQRIYEACHCPVGLENLAFAYSLDEVKEHGAFLEQLIEPINGFIILDLHNLYCQLHNFEVDFESIIKLYPLHRVREIHISGGSWEDSLIRPEKKIRRDTHDDRVPEEVFDLLPLAINRCPNLKFVVLEQLGNGLQTEVSRSGFQQDFRKMSEIVKTANSSQPNPVPNDFLPGNIQSQNAPLEDLLLHTQQLQLSEILENAAGVATARQDLANSCLAHSPWKVEDWEPVMLETALQIAQKWKNGWRTHVMPSTTHSKK